MLLGGSDVTGQKVSRSCCFYDKGKGLVSAGLKMRVRRFNFGCLSYKNYVYVFGGFKDSSHRVT